MIFPNNSMKYLCKKNIKGRFTHMENNYLLYFNNKENELESYNIQTYLEDLDRSYSKEKNYYRNYLYLQEIDYKIGNVCAAIFSQDKKFYRVKIQELLDYDKVLVCFIDYGNCEIIFKSELAPLPEHISTIEPLALVCMIPHLHILEDATFSNLINEICVRDMTITIEDHCMLTIADKNDIVEKIPVHLISFLYRRLPIRDYLIKNRIAKERVVVYERIIPLTNHDRFIPPKFESKPSIRDLSMDQDLTNGHEHSPVVPNKHSRTVIITSLGPKSEIFVHEFCRDVKLKLESLQHHISRVVDAFTEPPSDNVFSKQNMYLTQFSEDMMWYRCRICNFDTSTGFLVQYVDFGNFEHKASLSDLILLKRDMGSDAVFLIDEEPIAHLCHLSPELTTTIPDSFNIKRYLLKQFVEPVRRLSITYIIEEEHSQATWIIQNIRYRHQNLHELLENQCILKDSNSNDKDAVSETSSHSLHDVAAIKVADYLLNGCPDLQEEFFTSIDLNRQYSVTHIGGFDDIWIDIGDGQAQEMCENLLSSIDRYPSVSEVVVDYIYGVKDVKPDGTSVAVRCKILDVCDNYIRIHLIDRGPIKRVLLDDIFSLTAEIIALPQQVLKFQLPNNLSAKVNADLLLASFKSLLEGQQVRIIRESLQSNILIDILLRNRSVLQTMIAKNVVSLNDSNDWFSYPMSHHNVCVQADLIQMHPKRHSSVYSSTYHSS